MGAAHGIRKCCRQNKDDFKEEWGTDLVKKVERVEEDAKRLVQRTHDIQWVLRKNNK